MTFDAYYLMDALKAVKKKDVKICIAGEMKPILLQPIGKRDSIHLISPIRTK